MADSGNCGSVFLTTTLGGIPVPGISEREIPSSRNVWPSNVSPFMKMQLLLLTGMQNHTIIPYHNELSSSKVFAVEMAQPSVQIQR